MADPQLTDYFRALVIFRHKSANPRDTFVNSFVFRNLSWLGNPDDMATHTANALKDFYMEPAPALPDHQGPSPTPASFMAGGLLGTDVQIRVYDLGRPKGERFPMVRNFTFTFGSGSPLPEEVAATLTFIAGMNRPRYRGRIYLGPLLANAVIAESASVGARVRLQPALNASLAAAGQRLKGVGGLGWSVLSQKDAQARAVTGGWCDNAVDIIRNRGPEWTRKQLWGSYEGRPVGDAVTR